MDHRVRKTISQLSAEIGRDVSLAKAARYVNLSVSRFRHLFKAETGLSVTRYLKALRLQRAKELIETTALSIKQVMVEVGVSDKSNFARDFKKTYGLSPVQHRKAFQNSIPEEPKTDTEIVAIFANK